ncbi:hypothetical protein HPB49_005750 [Dermacentor silvarum]|uniref:Uncharacterized protein n=1 Tax=Dermacentor silvarum TaxID=543639 RepID=A0ACB8C7H7_DERSI|nr:hypothetical protein HPB49_005750 [Dermacentor silvarum]
MPESRLGSLKANRRANRRRASHALCPVHAKAAAESVRSEPPYAHPITAGHGAGAPRPLLGLTDGSLPPASGRRMRACYLDDELDLRYVLDLVGVFMIVVIVRHLDGTSRR